MYFKLSFTMNALHFTVQKAPSCFTQASNGAPIAQGTSEHSIRLPLTRFYPETMRSMKLYQRQFEAELSSSNCHLSVGITCRAYTKAGSAPFCATLLGRSCLRLSWLSLTDSFKLKIVLTECELGAGKKNARQAEVRMFQPESRHP